MAKATTVTVERTSSARIPLGRRLGGDAFESIREAAEGVEGVEKVTLDNNGQVMCVDLLSTHTSAKKSRAVLDEVAKLAGIGKIEVVSVV